LGFIVMAIMNRAIIITSLNGIYIKNKRLGIFEQEKKSYNFNSS